MSKSGLLGASLLATLVVGAMPAGAAEPSAHAMHVYKTPWCGCCDAWTDHMKGLGYKVEVTNLNDLSDLRRRPPSRPGSRDATSP